MKNKIIIVKNSEDFELIKKRKKNEILDNLPEIEKKYIRAVFNESSLDAHKEACIEIANLHSFNELSEELQAYLYTDRFLATI